MSELFQSRRIVALIAAYAIALQALLLPLSVAAQSSIGASLYSAAVTGERSSSPAGHDTGCPCAAGCGMRCCVQTLASLPPAAVALCHTRAIAITPAPAIAPAVRSSVNGV